MKDLFQLGKRLTENLNKANWVFQELTGDHADAIDAETRVGRDLAEAMKQEHPLDTNQSVVDFLEGMGNYLTQHLNDNEYQFAFRPIDSDNVNAFVLPGGFVFVTRGLLQFCEWDQGEIAFVVAHEIGHVVKRHAKEAIRSDLLKNAASVVSPATRVLQASLQRVSDRFMLSEYSKEREFEADAFAVRLTHRAGFQRNGPISFFNRLPDNINRSAAKERYTLFVSHPPPDERIALIRQVWDSLND